MFVLRQYKHMYDYTANTALFTKISIVTTLLLFFLGGFAFSNHRSHQSELYALMLFALCGGIILFGYQNMVTLFLGVEILSIPLYVMAGANKTDLRSNEASIKYFLWVHSQQVSCYSDCIHLWKCRKFRFI
jgi:NADH-quinone oxidoreductase subunit N